MVPLHRTIYSNFLLPWVFRGPSTTATDGLQYFEWSPLLQMVPHVTVIQVIIGKHYGVTKYAFMYLRNVKGQSLLVVTYIVMLSTCTYSASYWAICNKCIILLIALQLYIASLLHNLSQCMQANRQVYMHVVIFYSKTIALTVRITHVRKCKHVNNFGLPQLFLKSKIIIQMWHHIMLTSPYTANDITTYKNQLTGHSEHAFAQTAVNLHYLQI